MSKKKGISGIGKSIKKTTSKTSSGINNTTGTVSKGTATITNKTTSTTKKTTKTTQDTAKNTATKTTNTATNDANQQAVSADVFDSTIQNVENTLKNQLNTIEKTTENTLITFGKEVINESEKDYNIVETQLVKIYKKIKNIGKIFFENLWKHIHTLFDQFFDLFVIFGSSILSFMCLPYFMIMLVLMGVIQLSKNIYENENNSDSSNTSDSFNVDSMTSSGPPTYNINDAAYMPQNLSSTTQIY